MLILVLVKEAPDTYDPRELDLETGLTDRSGATAVIDEPSARALNTALKLASLHAGSSVEVLGLGPEAAVRSLRKCIAMGASKATLISDPLFIGSDLTLTAQVCALAIRRIEPDLVLAGDASTDGATGALCAMLSELLDMPCLDSIDSIEVGGTDVTALRGEGLDTVTIEAGLPAIASVTERLPDPPMPGIKGILAAKNVEIPVWNANDIGMDEAAVLADPRSILLSVQIRPVRQAGKRVVDVDGDSATAIAALISDAGLT